MITFNQKINETKNKELFKECLSSLIDLGVDPIQFIDWYFDQKDFFYTEEALCEGLLDQFRNGYNSSLNNPYALGGVATKLGDYAGRASNYLGKVAGQVRPGEFLNRFTGGTNIPQSSFDEKIKNLSGALDHLAKRLATSPDFRAKFSDPNFQNDIINLRKILDNPMVHSPNVQSNSGISQGPTNQGPTNQGRNRPSPTRLPQKSFNLNCPHCGIKLKVNEKLKNKKAYCPSCKDPFFIDQEGNAQKSWNQEGFGALADNQTPFESTLSYSDLIFLENNGIDSKEFVHWIFNEAQYDEGLFDTIKQYGSNVWQNVKDRWNSWRKTSSSNKDTSAVTNVIDAMQAYQQELLNSGVSHVQKQQVDQLISNLISQLRQYQP